jgi:hypothetical protein
MLKLLQCTSLAVVASRPWSEWISLKEGTAIKSMLVSMAVVLTFCAAQAAAAEFPKTGEAEYDTYYVGNPVAKIDSGVGTGAIVDETGITRNVKGEGPFHDMSVRCLSTVAVLKPTKMLTTYSRPSTTKTTT